MKISTTGAVLFLALFAATASAASTDQEATNAQTGEAQSRGEQGQHDMEGAHGYQNPAGEDPQPRLTEETIENAHGTDAAELEDDEHPHQH